MSAPQLRPATPADLPLIFRAERDYIASIEPHRAADWAAAIDRNLALWIAHLDRTTVLEVGSRAGPEPDQGDNVPAGFVM